MAGFLGHSHAEEIGVTVKHSRANKTPFALSQSKGGKISMSLPKGCSSNTIRIFSMKSAAHFFPVS